MIYLGHQMRLLTDVASDVALYDTDVRLARLLLRHIDKRKNPDSDQNLQRSLIADLSHEELATMIGSARVVVNGHIQNMKSDGSVQARRGHMEISDIQKLLDKVEGI